MIAVITLKDKRQIKLKLESECAPETVNNFVKLSKEGFYAGLCFHRVIDKFMIQGGGFIVENGALTPKNAAPIRGEFLKNRVNNPLKHESGTISMARTSDPNSASSQFFICAEPCAYLDGAYAAFGKVVDNESLEVVRAVSKVKTGKWMAYDDVPVVPVVIESVEIID